jgi:type VII secretion protein EccB
MATGREDLQALRFAEGRMHAALVTGDPDDRDPLLVTGGTWMLVGVLVAALVSVAFGLYGLVRHDAGGSAVVSSVLIVERETGTRFLYDDERKELHPVLNYASARLILGRSDVEVRQLSSRTLANWKRGLPLGLPGLPDDLPSADRLINGPWVACTSDGSAPWRRLSIGSVPPGQLKPAQAALVTPGSGEMWLIQDGFARKILQPEVFAALGLVDEETKKINVSVRPVSSEWLAAVPRGGDIFIPRVPGQRKGATVTYPGGSIVYSIGDLLHATAVDGRDRYFVAMPGRPVEISLVAVQLLRGTPTKAIDLRQASLEDMTPAGPESELVQGLPSALPDIVTPAPSALLCVAPGNTDKEPAQIYSPGTTWSATSQLVNLPPGTGVIARTTSASGTFPTGTVFLTTGSGVKYPVVTSQNTSVEAALESLGYRGVRPVPVAAAMLGLIPTGAALDAEHVRTPTSSVTQSH